MLSYLGRKIPPTIITFVCMLIGLNWQTTEFLGMTISETFPLMISNILWFLLVLNIASIFVDGVVYLSDTRSVSGHILSFLIVGYVVWRFLGIGILYVIIFGVVDIFVKQVKSY